MLTIRQTSQQRFSDGPSRRGFLQVGALGIGGLTLVDLLRLQAQGTIPKKTAAKSVIFIYLAGGPKQVRKRFLSFAFARGSLLLEERHEQDWPESI
jgi:hypothetical protein